VGDPGQARPGQHHGARALSGSGRARAVARPLLRAAASPRHGPTEGRHPSCSRNPDA
jgi:hypothetical protein